MPWSEHLWVDPVPAIYVNGDPRISSISWIACPFAQRVEPAE